MWIRVFSYGLAVLLHAVVLLASYLSPEPLHQQRRAEAQERLLTLLVADVRQQQVVAQRPVVFHASIDISETAVPSVSTPVDTVVITPASVVTSAVAIVPAGVSAGLPLGFPAQPRSVHKKRHTTLSSQQKTTVRPITSRAENAHDLNGPVVDVDKVEQTSSGVAETASGDGDSTAVDPSTEGVAAQNGTDGEGLGDNITVSAGGTDSRELSAIELESLVKSYARAVSKMLRDRFPYPRAASRRTLEGTVTLELVIDPQGNVLSHRLVATSGHPILDDAAMVAAEAVSTVPKPPEVLSWTTRGLHVPVVYRLGKRSH